MMDGVGTIVELERLTHSILYKIGRKIVLYIPNYKRLFKRLGNCAISKKFNTLFVILTHCV